MLFRVVMRTVFLNGFFRKASSQMFFDLIRDRWDPDLFAHETFSEDDSHLLTLMEEGLHQASTAICPAATQFQRMSGYGAELDKAVHVFLEEDALLLNGFNCLILGIGADNITHIIGVI